MDVAGLPILSNKKSRSSSDNRDFSVVRVAGARTIHYRNFENEWISMILMEENQSKISISFTRIFFLFHLMNILGADQLSTFLTSIELYRQRIAMSQLYMVLKEMSVLEVLIFLHHRLSNHWQR
jgi:hypothetical protein